MEALIGSSDVLGHDDMACIVGELRWAAERWGTSILDGYDERFKLRVITKVMMYVQNPPADIGNRPQNGIPDCRAPVKVHERP